MNFNHKPYGSVVGTGTYKFRHYGNEQPVPVYGDCLCFTAAKANSTISMDVVCNRAGLNFQYSTNKLDWNTFTPLTTVITLSNIGDKVYFKGNNTNGIGFMYNGYVRYCRFKMSGLIAASGNIMSLIDDGVCTTTSIPSPACFARMFESCAVLTTPPSLPATSLNYQCYEYMFGWCSRLTYVPELPATQLYAYCYSDMFQNCTSLRVGTSSTSEQPQIWRIPTTGVFTNTSTQDNMFLNCITNTPSPTFQENSYSEFYTQNTPV